MNLQWLQTAPYGTAILRCNNAMSYVNDFRYADLFPTLNKQATDTVVRSLGLRTPVEQKWLIARPPAVGISNTPNSHTNTVSNIQTSLDRSLVVRCRSTLDVKLSDGTLAHIRTHALQRTGEVGDGPVVGQVRLRTDTIDGNTSGDPALHSGCEAAGLGVASGIEIVVVDVELCARISGPGCAEGDADEVCRVSMCGLSWEVEYSPSPRTL
jgi:hypothetical protein